MTQAVESTNTEATEPETKTEALGEKGIKALQEEREARSKAEQLAASLKAQLDTINAEKLTDLEKAQKEAADSKAEAQRLQAEALRWRIAAKNGISDEDAETFLTGIDEESLTKQAERLSALAKTPSLPRPDPSQGARGTTAKATPKDEFAQWLENLG